MNPINPKHVWVKPLGSVSRLSSLLMIDVPANTEDKGKDRVRRGFGHYHPRRYCSSSRLEYTRIRSADKDKSYSPIQCLEDKNHSKPTSINCKSEAPLTLYIRFHSFIDSVLTPEYSTSRGIKKRHLPFWTAKETGNLLFQYIHLNLTLLWGKISLPPRPYNH